MPTFAELVGVPAPEGIDGISLLPALVGDRAQPEHDHLYWEYHGLWNGAQAVRTGRWKGVRLGGHDDPDAPIELYDLESDPGEERDLAAQNPDVVARIRRIMGSRTEAVLADWNFARDP